MATVGPDQLRVRETTDEPVAVGGTDRAIHTSQQDPGRCPYVVQRTAPVANRGQAVDEIAAGSCLIASLMASTITRRSSSAASRSGRPAVTRPRTSRLSASSASPPWTDRSRSSLESSSMPASAVNGWRANGLTEAEAPDHPRTGILGGDHGQIHDVPGPPVPTTMELSTSQIAFRRAEEILRRRYAEGEIDEDEYLRRQAGLR